MTDLPPCQAASELRRLTDAALSAVAPDGAVLRHLHLDGGKLTLIDESGAPAWSGGLDAYRRIRVLGAGKGAAPMAAALENLLGDRISDGLVIVKYGHDLPEGQRTRRIRIKEGGRGGCGRNRGHGPGQPRGRSCPVHVYRRGQRAYPGPASGNPAGRYAAAYLYAAGMRSDNP